MQSAAPIFRCDTSRATLGASFALFLSWGCARGTDQSGRDAQLPLKPSATASIAATAAGAAMTTSPPSAPSARPPSPMSKDQADLALHDMSFFHGDGERLAFSRDGRVLYEHLSRRDGLRRWTKTLDVASRQELSAIANRFAASRPETTSRTGIPDEVTVAITYRDGSGAITSIGVWEADIGKLPAGHVVRDFRALVRRLGESMRAAGAGTQQPPEGTKEWPHLMDSVPR